MNLLELFAGSRSIGNAAEKYGLNVFSVDWTDYENIDLIIDIGELEKKRYTIYTRCYLEFARLYKLFDSCL
jgi:hypothetical protein